MAFRGEGWEKNGIDFSGCRPEAVPVRKFIRVPLILNKAQS
jgi:hypothetical protein